MNNLLIRNAIAPSAQRGVVLIVGLVMVLLISIVGLSAVRSSGLQEAMAGNTRDRNLAFQAAESALTFGESLVAPTNKIPPPMNNSDGNFNKQVDTPSESVIFYDEIKWDQKAKVTGLELIDVYEKPAYIIEQLQTNHGDDAALEGSAIDKVGLETSGNPIPYRISSKGAGGNEKTIVILQSTYKRRF